MDWNGSRNGKKTSSCKKYNQSLNALVITKLRFALLLSEFWMFCAGMGVEIGGMVLRHSNATNNDALTNRNGSPDMSCQGW